MNKTELKAFLDEKVNTYNNPNFIETDPIQIPHLFTLKEDIEITGFLVATIAWGNRKSIITNGNRLVELMGNSPYDFVMNYSNNEFEKIEQCLMRNESFPWGYISHGVSNGDGFEGRYFYMIHWFFNYYQIQSQYFDLLIPLLEKLKCMDLDPK